MAGPLAYLQSPLEQWYFRWTRYLLQSHRIQLLAKMGQWFRIPRTVRWSIQSTIRLSALPQNRQPVTRLEEQNPQAEPGKSKKIVSSISFLFRNFFFVQCTAPNLSLEPGRDWNDFHITVRESSRASGQGLSQFQIDPGQ